MGSGTRGSWYLQEACLVRTRHWCVVVRSTHRRRCTVRTYSSSSAAQQVSSMTVAIGLSQGFDDDLFVVCFVFTCIVSAKPYISAESKPISKSSCALPPRKP